VARESKSADDIAALINDSVRVVPGLEKVKIEVARLPRPDVDGCNWMAHHSPATLWEHCPNQSACLTTSSAALNDISISGICI